MKTFIKPKDLFVEENNSEYILKKGYLHQHSIAIDKEESSKNFIVKFKTLIAENQIELNENDDVIDDFNKLTQLNLIHKKIDTFNKICIITDKAAKAFFKDHLDQVDEIYEFNENSPILKIISALKERGCKTITVNELNNQIT